MTVNATAAIMSQVPVRAGVAPDLHGSRTKEKALDSHADLDRFLASVERQAFRYACHFTRDRDEALDLVQDAMLKLASRYATRPPEEWTPLFFRILRNRIRDWQRRQVLSARLFFWRRGDADDAVDPVELAAAVPGESPDRRLQAAEAMAELDAALQELPARQREAFLLRTMDGLDVADAADAMGVSAGSVKTHYFRAVHRLRERLGEHWDGTSD